MALREIRKTKKGFIGVPYQFLVSDPGLSRELFADGKSGVKKSFKTTHQYKY
jgi:hypothetical protein